MIYCLGSEAQWYPDSVTSSHVNRDNQNSCSISCSLVLVHADGWLNLCCILAKFLDLAWSYWNKDRGGTREECKTHTHTKNILHPKIWLNFLTVQSFISVTFVSSILFPLWDWDHLEQSALDLNLKTFN